MIEVMFAIRKDGFKVFTSEDQISIHHLDFCISCSFLLKFGVVYTGDHCFQRE